MELPAQSVDPEKLEQFRKACWGVWNDFRDDEFGVPLVTIKGYAFPADFVDFLPKIRSFPIDPKDVLVCSFPKSGTTWMQHIVWYICTQQYECEEPIDFRFPELDLPTPYPPVPENLDVYAAKEPPRFFKTHVPAIFLPEKAFDCKIVYCYRNMKDCCVSYFHHARSMLPTYYQGTFDQFADLFLRGRVQFGPWDKHIKTYYDAQQAGKQVLMVAFEDMKKDRMGVIKQVAQFLGKELTKEQFQKVYDETSFEALKNNESGNYSYLQQIGFWDGKMQPFMRKGVVGDWANHFSEERKKQFDDFVASSFANMQIEFRDSSK